MANDTKQQQQPKQAPAPPHGELPGRFTTEMEAENALAAAGWEWEGDRTKWGEKIWRSPVAAGSKRSSTVSVELPNPKGDDGGKPVVVTQTVGPPSSWTYPTSKALVVQREMEADGAPVSPLQRLDALGARYDTLCRDCERLATQLEVLRGQVLPEKAEALRNELLKARNVALTAAAGLRDAVKAPVPGVAA